MFRCYIQPSVAKEQRVQRYEWTLLVYRVPTEPASRRVSVWRDLKRLGALYLQQCVCILPRREEVRAELDRIVAKIPTLDGECLRFELPPLPTADEEKIIGSFRALRDKEYAEIVEECATKFVKEIEFEHFRQNYSFEEVEEIAQDLEKIRRWYGRVVERDWFASAGRGAVEEWIARCQELLNDFEQTVYTRSGGDDDPQQTIALSPLGLVPTLPQRVPAPAPIPEMEGSPRTAAHDEEEIG
jgi:hypothetical protein